MKLTILAYFSLALFHASVFAILTTSENELNSNKPDQLYFDAHNHTGGVLPPFAIVDAQKYVYGQKISLEELREYWAAFINSEIVQERILNNSLYTNNTKMLIRCDEPNRVCSTAGDKECEESIRNALYNLFSSSPLTGFSTAYGIRRDIVDIVDRPGISSSNMRAQAFLYELARTKVDLVEMSLPALGGLAPNEGIFEVERYINLIKDINSSHPSRENEPFKKRLAELNLTLPKLKWLLMVHTTELAQISEDQTVNYFEGKCSPTTMSDSLKTDPKTGLYHQLATINDVVGVDVAGPEVSCFTDYGMEKFKLLAKTTYEAAKAKQKNGHQGKLVVRVHVGEGYPLMPTAQTRDSDSSCERITAFPEVELAFTRTNFAPVHRIEAQKNIDFILNAIEALKKEFTDIDKFIVFRLAHLTHITDNQAKRAKSLNITADVNLSSNIATQAWTINPEIINQYLRAKGIKPNQISDLLQSLRDNGASLSEIFGDHGLKWLLLNDVPTVLGSDGSGVEHSHSMRDEYLMARDLINHWNATDPNFKAKKITINNLLLNQKFHYTEMGYSPK